MYGLPSQGSPLPSVVWLHLRESHFSQFIQRELAMEAFQPPTLTLKPALLQTRTPAMQPYFTACTQGPIQLCLLWTSSSFSTEPRRGNSSKQDIPTMVLAPMPLSDEPEMILASFAASLCWLMDTVLSAPILGGLQVD